MLASINWMKAEEKGDFCKANRIAMRQFSKPRCQEILAKIRQDGMPTHTNKEGKMIWIPYLKQSWAYKNRFHNKAARQIRECFIFNPTTYSERGCMAYESARIETVVTRYRYKWKNGLHIGTELIVTGKYVIGFTHTNEEGESYFVPAHNGMRYTNPISDNDKREAIACCINNRIPYISKKVTE